MPPRTNYTDEDLARCRADRRSISEIASIYGVSMGSVCQKLNRLGLPIHDTRKSDAHINRMIRTIGNRLTEDQMSWFRQQLSGVELIDLFCALIVDAYHDDTSSATRSGPA